MSKVRIVTDRASDLPDNIAAKYGIEIAEMDVAFGEDVYYGGKGITIEDFYARMKKEKELPKHLVHHQINFWKYTKRR